MNEISKYEEVSRIIPWATQTNAKRVKPLTEEVSPYFIKRGKGAKVINTLDEEYTDFFCACGPIILGYAYEPVDSDVKKEIDNGVVFSLASPLEYELSIKIREIFPYFDWVRFLKTGNDAATAAVRLARAYTGKNKIMQYGYHGWNDWAQTGSGFGQQRGIPSGILAYTIHFEYNEIDYISKCLKNDPDIAGIILTPYDWTNEPENGFLQKLRELCDYYDIPLIFDEVLTGFRMGITGAQGEFGVQPDISVFAKAVANGYPISVITGKAKYANALVENKTIITTTYAGETLSLRAALSTLRELKEKNVFDHMNLVGGHLKQGLQTIVEKNGYPLRITGRPGLLRVVLNNGSHAEQLRIARLLSKVFLEKRLLVKELGTLEFYLNFAHTMQDIEFALETAEEAFARVL